MWVELGDDETMSSTRCVSVDTTLVETIAVMAM